MVPSSSGALESKASANSTGGQSWISVDRSVVPPRPPELAIIRDYTLNRALAICFVGTNVSDGMDDSLTPGQKKVVTSFT